MQLIPIFPLNLVIFPNSYYPLHIFEERYKKMIQYCLDEQSEFCIISRIENKESEIGSLVSIEQIINKYEDGRLDIIIKGTNRIKILNKEYNEYGYLQGNYHIIEEDYSSPPTYAALRKTLSNFKNLLKIAKVELDDNFWNNLENTQYKSYKIAEKSGLSLQQQIDLLSILQEDERLKYLTEHFDRVTKYLSQSDAIKNIVWNDGYLN